MKKFLAGEIRLDKFYGISLKKRKNTYIFEEELEIPLEEIKNYLKKFKSKISIDTIDYQIQKVSIPKIKDENTKELLIKNRLSQIIEDIEKFKILFFKINETESTEEYNVYLIPIYIVNELPFEEEDFLNIDILTLSIFSVAGLTNKFLKEKNIFAVVVDNYKIVISFIQNGVLEYSRTTPVPAYISTEEEFLNFYYENINLTYMYIYQNLRKDIDVILFLGNIYNNADLVEQVYGFARKPIAVIFPIDTIKNISVDKFHKYISHIGNLFLDLSYDIRSNETIEKKYFQIYSKTLFFIFLLLFLIVSILDINQLLKNSEYKDKLVKKVILLNKQYQDLVKQSTFSKDIEYYINYLDEITKLNDELLLKFLYDIRKIFSIHKFENITLEKKEDSLTIALNSQVYFPSLVEATLFKSKLEDSLKEIQQKFKDIKIRKTILLDINKFIVDIDINLERELKNDI